MAQKSQHKNQGFTLVELAIVLVIVGLIIGGILAGQDMIKSAEIRSTIQQWEIYNSAKNVFRDKYFSIPGDINQDRALEYGFYDRTGTAAPGNGDANGLLQACATTAAAGLLAGCETTLFWRDMNTANMVDGFFQVADENVATVPLAELINWLPTAAVGRDNYWTVFSVGGRNWLQLTGISALTAGAYSLNASLTPFEAFSLDRKTDDANPFSGTVQAMNDGTALNTPAVAGATSCVFTDNTYNQTTEVLANTPSCQLRWLFN